MREVTIDISALGMIGHPCFERRHLAKIAFSNSIGKGLGERLFVLRIADFPLVGGGENVVELGVQGLAMRVGL